MATNDFKVFAGPSSDTYSPSAWAALTTLLANGFVTGQANTKDINTLMRQVSTVAAGVAEFIKGQGINAVDDGSAPNFAAAFLSALSLAQAAVGEVKLVISATPLPNTLAMNGALVSRTTYAGLWAWAQANAPVYSDATWTGSSLYRGAYSSGDGSTTFRLPNVRGTFPRFYHAGDPTDPDYLTRNLGYLQGFLEGPHTHAISDPGHTHTFVIRTLDGPNTNQPTGNGGSGAGTSDPTSNSGTGISILNSGTNIGAEARPVNLMLLGCVRYQ